MGTDVVSCGEQENPGTMINRLALLTTTRCSLRCKHCLRGYPTEHADFPLEVLPRLLEDARLFGARHAALTGGEPGLHPQFGELVGMLDRAGYTWHFVSNGIDPDLYLPAVERFRASLTSVTLSLDGASAPTHDALRGLPGAFDRLLEALRIFKAAGLPVNLSATLNRTNRDDLPAIIQLAAREGAASVHVGAVIPAPWNVEYALGEQERLACYQQLTDLGGTAGIPVKYFSSLHTPGGVHFCRNLSLRELAFNAQGELVYCCDLAQGAGTAGSLLYEPLAALVERWLDWSHGLQRQRAQDIACGRMPEGFDQCQYCGEASRKN
jgi:pyruvate-formate lyase-activating enzyme